MRKHSGLEPPDPIRTTRKKMGETHSWIDFVENPDAVGGIFEAAPSLSNVEVTSLSIDRDGPALGVSVAVGMFPKTPPSRWPKSANAVTIQLELIGVSGFSLSGWSTENIATITIQRRPNGLEMLISGKTIELNCRCGWLRIKGIKAYRNEQFPILRNADAPNA
jgi:hypothetical protein